MTDREKAGLRGPVKTCVEENIYPTHKYSVASEYTIDGKLLTSRTNHGDVSEWLTANTYDADGRLLKTTTVKSGEPATESLYTYDEVGRLLSITNKPHAGGRTDFRHDAEGRKIATQTFDAETLQRAQSSAFTGSPWDAAVRAGISVPIGGSVITIYDERDQQTELQIVDAEGEPVNRFVRTYNANGRIIEEKPIWVNPAALFFDKIPAEQRNQLSPEHLKQMNTVLATLMSGKAPAGTQYTYDSQNRLTNILERNLAFEKTTTIAYDDRGEKAEERTNFTGNSVIPVGVPHRRNEEGHLVPSNPTAEPPASPHLSDHSSIIRYAYQYDTYGNWTQQIASYPSQPDQPSTARNRKLTYY